MPPVARKKPAARKPSARKPAARKRAAAPRKAAAKPAAAKPAARKPAARKAAAAKPAARKAAARKRAAAPRKPAARRRAAAPRKTAPARSAADIEGRLNDEQIIEVFDLLGGADSVELKLTIPSEKHRAAIRALDLDPLEAQIRQVFFFDTPDLKLDKAGVVVRARRVAGKGEDSVVKLRPVVPDDLAPKLRKLPNLVVEVDAMPGGFVCSGTLKEVVRTGRVSDVFHENLPIQKLYSKEQRAYFTDHAPAGVTLNDLSILGPIFVLKVKSPPGKFGRRLVTEIWLYPDGSRILELSTKCAPGEAFEAAAQARAYLAKKGIDAGGEQQTKTRKALTFFSKELQAGT